MARNAPVSTTGATSPATRRGPFRDIPYMGVIYVVAEAMKLGYRNGHPDWANLGQGQPEVGAMEGAPRRIARVDLEPGDHAYGPIGGAEQLREAIAEHYNRLYRQGRRSKYRAANVSVACGGRLVLSRVFAALEGINVGYQVPDYTAYEDMIDYHEHRFTPVVLPTDEASRFRIPAAELDRDVVRRGLGAVVLSNPCNPTGAVVRGTELEAYVKVARERDCLLVLDEFYSHFVYEGADQAGKAGSRRKKKEKNERDARPAAGPVSAAAHVDDVDRDPILLVDGLTKSFRYPGWRLGWAVGPAHLVDVLGRAASAIDGGPSQPVQRAALQVLEPKRADQETAALRSVFARKRNVMVAALRDMGIRPWPEPEGTFYAWASLADLPPPLDDGMEFFRRALKERVLTVPGVFFDVNPGKRRPGPSPLRRWMRFSFGPPEASVRMGLERLAAMVGKAR